MDAIGRGEDPPFEADDERAVDAVARPLGRSGHLDQVTYHAAHRFLGDAGMVQLVSRCGCYSMISFLLRGVPSARPGGRSRPGPVAGSWWGSWSERALRAP